MFCREPLVARNLKSPRISGRVISALTLLAVLALNRTGFVDRLNASQATSGAPSGRDDSARMAKFERMARDGSEAALESRLQAYVRQHPSSARAHYLLGYVYFQQKRNEEAVRELLRSVELDGNDAHARALLSWVHMTENRCDLAQNELERAVELRPGWDEAHYRLGRVYLIEEDFMRAKSEFERAIKLSPDYREAWNALGVAMEALNDGPGARASFEKANAVGRAAGKPLAAPYINISGYYNRRGEPARAIEFAKKALAINPKADLACFELGRAYRIQEKWSEAQGALERAIALKSDTAQYHYVLSIVYRKLGKQAESRRSLETFRDLDRKYAEIETQRRRGRTMSSHRDEAAFEPLTEGFWREIR